MAEKLEIIGSVKLDSSGADASIKSLSDKLKEAKASLDQMNATFGKGSAEAKKAAQEVANIEAQLNKVKSSSANIEQPVKSLKAQLKEANAELVSTIDKFGALSPEAANAASKVANLKDKIGDAKTLSDAFNPDAKFKGLSNAIQGATGALTAITGAQALFGSESKAVQETLLKVQGAMAFSQGINSVLESKDAFKALYAQIASIITVKKADVAVTESQIVVQEGLVVAQEAATAASKVLKGALIATGIGALLVAVGTLIAYWDKIKESVTGVSKELEKQAKDSKAKFEKDEKAYKLIEGSTEQLKQQGKSEREILDLKLKGLDILIKDQEVQIQTAENTKKAQVEAAKRNAEFTKGIMMMLTSPLQVILGTIDAISFGLNKIGVISDDTYKKFGSLREDFTNSLTKLVFDPVETEKEGQKVIDEQRDKLNELKEQRAGFQNDIKEIDKNAAEDAKKKKEERDKEIKEKEEKRRQEQLEAEKKHIELLKENAEKRAKNAKELNDLLNQIELNGIKDAAQRRDKELEINRENELNTAKEGFQKGELNLTEYLAKQAAIRAKYKQQEDQNSEADAKKSFDDSIKKLDADIANNDLAFQARKDALDKESALIEEAKNKNVLTDDAYKKAVEKNSADRKAIRKAELEAQLGYARQFGSILSGLSDLLGKNTKAGKKAAIAGLLIDQGLNVAKITMDTIASTKAIAKKYAAIPGGQIPAAIEIGLNIAQGALSVAKSVQAAKKGIADINAAGGGGSEGGSAAAGGGDMSAGGQGAPIAPQANQTALPQDQINQLATANAATRAYVLESDVSGNQERITRINRAARIS